MHERIEQEKSAPAPSGPFQCQICGKEFDQIQSIKIHLGKHKANEENTLEEYLQKKALRIQASKERYRQNARVYKQKYKVMQIQKQRILDELGLDPGNPIVKTINFKNLMKSIPEDGTDVNMGTDAGGVVGCGEGGEILVSNPTAAANIIIHSTSEDTAAQLLAVEGGESATILTATTTAAGAVVNQHQTEEQQQLNDVVSVEQVETNIVSEPEVNVVIDTSHMEAGKGVEYVVAEGSTVVVEHGTEVTEISMEDLDSGLTLLNFLRSGKAV